MKKYSDEKIREMEEELSYLRKSAKKDTSRILSLNSQLMNIHQELEKKRRGVKLMAELTTIDYRYNHKESFISVAKRINATLDMQRTLILMPEKNNLFRVDLTHGYKPHETIELTGELVEIPDELLQKKEASIINSSCPDSYLSEIRKKLKLPYFILAPVLIQGNVVAVLVAGRLTEEDSCINSLCQSCADNVQAVSSYLAAIITGQRLEEAEKRTQIMLDATPLGACLWDEDFNLVDCNQEAPRLFDLSNKHEFIDNFFKLIPEQQPSGILSLDIYSKELKKAFKVGYRRFEWLHQKLNGEPIPTEITLVRVRQGRNYIVSAYIRDLRELKSMLKEIKNTNIELHIARDLAEKSSKAKSEFLANMSHEIRTPMNAIMGMIHLLSKGELSENQRQYISQAEDSSKLLLSVINDILDFSKINAGNMHLEFVEFSIHKLAEDIYNLMQSQAEEKNLLFTLNLEPDVPDCVMGDPLRMEQILINLVSNALKFTSSGSIQINISASRLEAYNLDEAAHIEKLKEKNKADSDAVQILFQVKDTGIGLSEEQKEELFKPFTQADNSLTRKFGGTGLGLAISHSLVELMGGNIWCEHNGTKGSTFAFKVPLLLAIWEKNIAKHCCRPSCLSNDSSQPKKEEQIIEAYKLENLNGLNILLAEDNDINQLIALELLQSKGINVDAVNNGVEALEAMTKKNYDLVLMDIQMPEMDGLSASKEIRKFNKDIPIIAMTAHTMHEDRNLSLKAGMNDHLTKPIDPQLLYNSLSKWSKSRP